MPRRCPTGFICTDTKTIVFTLLLLGLAGAVLWATFRTDRIDRTDRKDNTKIYVVHQQQPEPRRLFKPDVYPEPVLRYGLSGSQSRGASGPMQQVGILTADGGSSSSASPDRTILPLYGRELDARRSRWNYFTRTDGSNPVQVPVRVGNRTCDDDTNGCNEVFNDDSVHIPALGRSFKATIYRKSFF